MPGALTGNVGATYDPNVKPFPGEDLYDGTDTAQGMAAALGAPNAALGSPLDPGQAYAVGTDEEGDDANWMNPEEHKAFYENEALNAQAGFDKENPTGMARVDQGNYGVAEPQSLLGQVFGGPAPVPKEQINTLAMRNLLMGDTIAKRESDEEQKREIAAATLKFNREKELKAAPGNTKAGKRTANIQDYNFLEQLKKDHPPVENANGEMVDSPQVVSFRMSMGGNRPVDGGNEYYVRDPETGKWKVVIKKGLNPKDDPKYKALIESQKQQQTRAQLRIDGGVSASKAIPDIKRSIQLLSEIKTGGIDALKLWAKTKFGVETGDEGLLSNMLAKNVLSQLRQTFGAAFTANEGQWLKEIEAGIGKSNAGNLSILNRVLKKAENYYQIGLSSADIMGDKSTMEAMKLQYDLDKTPAAEKQASTTSKGPSLEELRALKAKRLNEKMLNATQSRNLGGRLIGY
jgi:hypothetical protein